MTVKRKLSDFNLSLSDLKEMLRNDQEIAQNHFGDYLMYTHDWIAYGHNYKVWLSHTENVKQGQSKWQIEYCGPDNDYKWQIISEGNN
jgi:hypothetical protein